MFVGFQLSKILSQQYQSLYVRVQCWVLNLSLLEKKHGIHRHGSCILGFFCSPDLTGLLMLDLVKFVICTLASRVHMTFYILTKRYTVPGNQGIHDKLNQIPIIVQIQFFLDTDPIFSSDSQSNVRSTDENPEARKEWYGGGHGERNQTKIHLKI